MAEQQNVNKRNRPDSSGQTGLYSDRLYLKRIKFEPPASFQGPYRTLTLQDSDGTIALTSQIPATNNFVTLTGNQTINSVKTFAMNPILTALTSPSNFVLTLPNTTNGTLALTSQIPSLSNYVDLTNPQSISGVKTFSSNPILTALTSPSNYTLTLPDIVSGTLALASQIPTSSTYVDLTSTQTITGAKTFNNTVQISGGYSLFASSIVGCLFYSNPIGGGGNISFDTTSASTFSAILKLPSLSSSVTMTIPKVSGILSSTVGSYASQKSQGLTLSDNQTITNSNYLAGSTINCDASTYTDSATATSGTVAQVSDVRIGQRTYSATNTGVTYTSAASLHVLGPPIAGTNVTITKGNAIQVDSGNVRLTSGQYISTALGSAGSPAIAIGASANDGIYSASAGALNFASSGTLRMSLTSTVMTLATSYNLSMSGTGLITSGSGGVTAPGPIVSSQSSSASNCSIRPTNDAGTGLYGTGTTLLGMSVGSTSAFSCDNAGNVSIGASLILPNGATSLRTFSQATVSTTFTIGTYTSGSFNIYCQVIGNSVTLSSNGFNFATNAGTQSNVTIVANTLPSSFFKPVTATYCFPISVFNTSGSSAYILQIAPSSITIGTFGNQVGTFNTSGSLNVFGFSVSYYIV